MLLETNKTLLRRYLAAWEAGDLDQMKQMLDPNCSNYNLVSGEKRGVEFELEACRIWQDAFEDTRLIIEQIVAEDDRVSVYWRLRATHNADFMGIEPTGRKVNIPGMEINRVANGKIVEIWRLSDTMSVMQQLNAVALGSAKADSH